ncbi:MAG: ATP synthase subunit I [Desulfobacterales bacterium]|nr:ATP synthase subunit I [Desulfobacterales bacterium]
MEAIRETQKKYCSRAMIAAIFLALFLIIIGYKPMGKGLVLGALFSVINFILMAETLPMKMGRTKRKSVLFSLVSVLARYGVMAIPLVAAIKYEQFNLFAVIPGLFMIQAVILTDQLIQALKPARGGQA